MTPRLLRPLAVAVCVAMALTALCDITLHDIAVDVLIEKNGSAQLTEVIDLTHNMHDDELIFNIGNKGAITISDFSVSEDGRRVSSNLDEKSNGYDLRWDSGNGGRHKYTLRYKLSNLVKSTFSQQAELKHIFIKAGLDLDHAIITVHHADGLLKDDDDMCVTAGLGATQMADADASKGTVVVESTSLGSNEKLGVRIVYDGDVFTDLEAPKISTDITAEELSSGMMTTTEPEAYSEGWLTKIWDYLLDHLLLSLIGIAALIWAVSFVIRKLIKLVP